MTLRDDLPLKITNVGTSITGIVEIRYRLRGDPIEWRVRVAPNDLRAIKVWLGIPESVATMLPGLEER